ncbi:transketolase C-terminal domain-containing protein [Desulfopila aestuarii]|uniref:Transketolase, C-terminal subunit n=1 Tax=Desulfopila aestuarii DSM 18488 TaxID=1121416 RepID=A0A1M7Y9N1_9BACT|nr:transketolase C-terminal domain-containing protein [Desulfopila aestuarii]SHO49344.1 Transketolase, C-terminal subunit [Desulfopila aestuarii DSM 18488]
MKFPIDLSGYTPLKLDLSQTALTAEQRATLVENIRIVRDSLVFFTALANVKGLGGHTGGAYDIVPELLIVDGFMKGSNTVHPVYFDEAGHRVAIQYMMAVLNGHRDEESLLHYREFGKGYYGHPEREDKDGVFFSSGRLGHMWSYVNGVAEADREKIVVMFGSDGSQMEGDDAEAARYAVMRNLKVKLMLDDNDVTIAGHPTQYMPGYDLVKTLEGHGLSVNAGNGEDLDALFTRIQQAMVADGPVALVNRRKMAVGVPGIEGLPKGHDVIPVNLAVDYLKARNYSAAVEILETFKVEKTKTTYLGSTPESGKCRDDFGKIVCEILDGIDEPAKKVLVVDSDLEGSCGLHHIRKNHPEVYVTAGIMERNNYSVAAGFGSEPGRLGIFGTFAAFQEMVISEITMARLNKANVIAHFSHSGVDDMADNTCHFGINNFFADNALAENDDTRLYFPADTLQMKSMLKAIFNDSGLRFVYSTRSATPWILDTAGKKMYDEGYTFVPGKDEVVREGSAGYIVSYGEMLYRCLDVVEQLKAEGIDVGLINKPTLNVIDEDMLAKVGKAPFVLVVETQNQKTGLGSRFGTWLLERALTPKFGTMGTCKLGQGGLTEQIPYQGMGSEDIKAKIRALIG